MIETLSSSVLAWLLTYLIHSTVLLGLALLLTHLRAWPPVVMDLMWKTALVGGLVTASVQLALEVRPAGSVALVTVNAPAPVAPTRADEPQAAVRRHEVQLDGGAQTAARASGPNGVGAAAVPRVSRPSVHTAAVLAWWLVALALGLAYAARRLILVGRLGDRDAVQDDRLLGELDRLTREAGLRRRPRLTSTARLSSPIALGVAEICVPETALTELDLEQQRSMLAHELAHLARRDPLWLAFGSVIERVLWIQPLNRVARRQIATAAEYLCDEWAVRRTGSGVALARCLAQVAEWIQSSPLGVPVAGMAEERSLLVSRVEKLLAARGGAPRSRRGPVLAAAVVVLATIAVAPSVTGSAARASGTAATSPVSAGLESAPGLSDASTRIDQARPGGSETDGESGETDGRSLSMTSSRTANSETSGDVDRASVASAPRDSTVVAALIARLKDENADVRRAAANALGKLDDARAVPALIAALGDREADVRGAAAEALGDFEDPRALNALSALLNDAERDVRKQALEALSEYESGVPVDGIIRLMQDGDAELRHAAAHAVGKWKDRRAGPVLVALIRDPSPAVRAAAIESLGNLRDVSNAAAIAPALGDSDAEVRHEALETLEELRSPIPEPTLLNLLRDRDAEVREKAADVAGERSIIAAIPLLRRMIDDPDEDVRRQAVEALGDIADDAAMDALRAALNSSDASVRREAAEALGERRQ